MESSELILGNADPDPEKTGKDKLTGKRVGTLGKGFAATNQVDKPADLGVPELPSGPKSSEGKLPRAKAPAPGK